MTSDEHRERAPRQAARVAGVGALASAGLAAYAFWEPYRFRIQRHAVPVGAHVPPLTLLHLSDTHLSARDNKLIGFLNKLPEEVGVPDLILATGDMIEGDEGIDPLIECLARLEARLGRFYVLGSHDYYSAKFRSYLKYFAGKGLPTRAPKTEVRRMEEALQEKGWRALTNTTEVIDSEAGRIRLTGVDDPYLDRHDTRHIQRAGDEVLALGLVHSPDVVSEWMLAGYDLVVAGHTHGGQVRFPIVGALVTNCSLPTPLACGLHPIGNGWLHVSPGLGTGKFSPIRFLCRPEATLLELRPSEN